jgi:hypothetical protein
MPTDAAIFRRLALSLPGTFEGSHMGHADFRIESPEGKGRIFATLASLDKGCGNVSLTPEQQLAFITELPGVFEPVKGGWGRMGMTHVHLREASEETLLGALTTAHRNVAEKLVAKKIKAKRQPKIAL